MVSYLLGTLRGDIRVRPVLPTARGQKRTASCGRAVAIVAFTLAATGKAVPPAAQLAADPTPVPTGQGAIFVPALSDGDSEPETLVFRDDRQVASGPTGRRIVVPPGRYSIRVGSGPARLMVDEEVTVAADRTVAVPVRWGGLRVTVVDENDIPHRGSYELIRASDRQPFAVGFGADMLLGEQLSTTLMPEGLYRIVRRGATYRARTDFATVLVPAGALVHFKLVVDPADGSFRGGGLVLPEELGLVAEASPWNRRYSVAVTLPFASSRNVVGATNQTSIGMEAFFDTYVTYQKGRNFLSGIFEIEEGFLRLDPEGTAAQPVQKTRDRIRADVFYSRFLKPRVGPYARFGLLMTAAPSEALFTEDGEVVIRRLDGRVEDLFVPANANLETSGAFAPVLLRQGGGLNARVLRTRSVTLDLRTGLGLRQNRFNEALFLDDNPASGPLEYREAPNFDQQGVEAAVVASARYRFLLVNTNLDVFGGFGTLDPTIDWRNTVSWRLTEKLSMDYIVDLLRLPRVRAENQISQSVLLRYSFGS